MVRVTRELMGQLGREPTPEELAKTMQMPVHKVRDLLAISRDAISLETRSLDLGRTRWKRIDG